MFGSTNPFGQQSSGGAFGQQASSNPFGGQAGGAFGQQASSNPFGGQTSAFGQTGGAASNSFAPKPFGSSVTAFGQPSAPAFGATSTGAFGQLSAPAFGSTSTGAFGQQATPAFGSTLTGAFGQQSAPMFGSTVTGAFGQQSAPAFGTTSTGAFGQQSTPAFGTTSTGAFGQQSAPAFGSTSTGAFGQPSTAVFGTPSPSPFGSSTPAFGASPTPAFGATSSGFGSGSLFGQKPSFGGFGSSPSQSSTFGSTFQQTQPAFGNSTFGATTPAFGSSSTSLFGASSNTTFGSTTPAFGSSGTGTFGVNTAPASSFGTSASAFSFGSSPSFGQTTATTGTTSFGTNPFGSQAAATTFGQSSFGNQSGGTRIQSYVQTPDPDSATSGTQPAAKFDSISAMPAYKEKSHEELRWEDYQRQDKGGPNPSAAPAVNSFLPPQQNFQPNQPIAANTFAPKPSPFATTPSPFSSSTSTQSFGQPVGAFSANTSPSLFANSTSSIFNPPSTTTNPFSTGSSINNNTQSAGLFQPSPAITQQPFSNSFNQQASTPAFSTSMFNTSSLGMTGGLFSNTSPPFATSTFQQPAPVQTTSSFSFQTQPGAFSGVSNMMNLAPFGQQTTSQPNMVMQPTMVPSPFGTLPVMPRMSIGNGGSSPSIQYGISSLPVAEKSLPSRTLLMVVPRHLSQRRIKLLPRKYNATSDGKVPFFADDEESPATPKADAFFIPRENPRSLIIRSTEHWPSRTVLDRQSIPRDSADLEKHIDASVGRERNKAAMSPSRTAPVENRDDQHASSEPEASARHTNGATIEKQQQQQLMPKLLSQADYFTEPSLAELAAKERAEPGCCGRVKDFVVGRRGYGSIKFLGETDVRGLDVESIVEFNQREVVVYKDDSKKPPVGEGLNRAAVVSLLKIKCMNKKTGDQYTEGPRVDRYREMLAKKAEEQGAEFISFDAANGEWKFRVKHFSSYGFAGAAQEEEAQGNSCGL